MKRKILVIMGALSLVASQFAYADTALQERVQLMEQELAELKRLLVQKNEQQAVEKQRVDEEIARVKELYEAQPKVKLAANTTLSYGGYIKVDGMYSDYDGGPRPGNIGDEILVPSLIPIGGESTGAHFDSHIKTSRFYFKTNTHTSAGDIRSHIELDLLTGDGDERISNSATSRIRHAYLAWDYAEDASILIGQSWSTFLNVGALPETIDFIGPTSGTIFNRQTQIRWTKNVGSGTWMLALENPSTSLSDAGSGIADNDIDDNTVPDIVARYNLKAGSHDVAFALMGRQIAYEDPMLDEDEYGFAVNLSGKYTFANGDDLKYSFSHGNLGRYIALNAFRDGGIDASGDLDLTTVTGGFLAYRHHWTDKLRSTFSYAIATADLADGLADTNSETVENLNLNLLYSPTEKLTFGGEWISASRELENGADGDLDRFQVMARYVF